MSVRPWRDIIRRKSRQIMVGNVPVGGDAPITVQTMTNTPTEDAAATIDQIRRCEEAGADIIRVSCPTEEATAAFRAITRAATVPIVADIHFHYKRALEAADAGAACLRINPGNIGSSERVGEVVRAAKANGCAIRIGVNAGSLEKDLLEKYGEPCPEALVESALDHIKLLQDHGLDTINVASDITLPRLAALRQVISIPIDLYIEGPDGLGGFTRYYEMAEVVRIAAPVYLKFGLRNAPNIYPSGAHLEGAAIATGRERVRRAAIGMELLARAGIEFTASPVGAPGLGIPVRG